jgi:HSP20 family protein
MARELMKWEPFREVSRLRREIDRLWEDFFGPSRRAFEPMAEAWMPAVDVSESGDKVTVKAEIPGMEAKDIEISMAGDTLTIKGVKKAEREEKEENYHLVERSYGSFIRSIRMPSPVDPDKIEANYKSGVVTITCPKKEEVKPKAIDVKTG